MNYPSRSKERMKVYRKKWNDLNPDKVKKARNAWRRDKIKALQRHRKYKYGLTPEQTTKMWNDQGGKCAICFDHFKDGLFHVDHCHIYGYVRGLLCPRCNRGLGVFRDDVDMLKRAAAYVDYWRPI